MRKKQVKGEFLARLFLSICLTIGIFIISNNKILDIVIKEYEKKVVTLYEYLESAVFHIHILPYFITSKIYIFNKILSEGSVSFKIPISVLDLCGSIIVCQNHRSNATKRPWFKSLVECTFMQFGGTTLTGILLGQTPSWVLSSNAFPALVLAWYLTNFCPYDLFHYILSSTIGMPILFILNIGSAISAGHAVTSWGLDKAAFNSFHKNAHKLSGSILTCIGCGTLSACGGGLLSTYFDHFGHKSDLKLNTFNRSFWLAVIYYCMLNKNNDSYFYNRYIYCYHFSRSIFWFEIF
jgi:hypothetical protein